MAIDKKDVHEEFMFVCGFIGIVLLILSYSSFNNMSQACTNITIYDSLTVILCISLALCTLVFSYFSCTNSHECYENKVEFEYNFEKFIGIIIFLGFIGTILMVSVVFKLRGDSPCLVDQNGTKLKIGKNLQAICWLLLGIFALLLFVPGGYIVYINID
jgi:magnesium-transporting ATPase (P-type)